MIFYGRRPKTKSKIEEKKTDTLIPDSQLFWSFSPAISGAASDVETVYQWSVMVCVTPKLPFGLDGVVVPTDFMLERANR
jgi:hypothetical protein